MPSSIFTFGSNPSSSLILLMSSTLFEVMNLSSSLSRLLCLASTFTMSSLTCLLGTGAPSILAERLRSCSWVYGTPSLRL